MQNSKPTSINLWRAEWLKVRKRPFNRFIFGIMLAVLAAFFIGRTITELVMPNRFPKSTLHILSFPYSLELIAQLCAIAGQLIGPLFIAQNIGSEYSANTWKMILPRYRARTDFLIAKLIVGLAAMLILITTMTALGVLLSWGCAHVLGLANTQPPTLALLADYLAGLGAAMLSIILYGTGALFTTIATRSAVGGAFLSFFGLQTTALLSPFYGRLALLMPYPHLPNILERWVFRDPVALKRVAAELGTISPAISILVVLIYSALFTIGGLYLFCTRDMSSE